MTEERALPEGPLLVIAPHPDDDAIGCGGLIARMTTAGERVRVVYCTSGEQGCPGFEPAVVLEWRERDARAAAAILGIERVTFWEEPDGGFAPLPELVHRLNAEIDELAPRTILTPHALEAHADHRQAFALLMLADARGAERLTYEVWTPMTEYAHVLDITAQLDTKIAAIRAHQSQVTRIAFDEAARALARYRSILHNRPHDGYAEVYGIL